MPAQLKAIFPYHLFISFLILLAGISLSASPVENKPSLLPVPQKITWSSAKFYMDGGEPCCDPRIRMMIVSQVENVPLNMDEAYRLVVTADSVVIEATGEKGFFRAMATFDQLKGRDSTGKFIAGCVITDWPAFSIRGFMHDAGRSFIPIDELKREIKILSGFKMQSEEGKFIVRQLLDEACQLFSGRFFHIGTDEVSITDPDFLMEMMAVVREHDKDVIGWLPGGTMDGNAIRQLWADVALPAGTTVIDSRYRYLNHTDYYSDLFSIYNSRLCDSDTGSELLAGGICCIWNDRKPSSVEDILISNSFYPVMLAFAERSWIGGGDDIKARGVRMGMPGDTTYEGFRDFESRLIDFREDELDEVPFPYLAQTDIFWNVSSQYPNGGDLNYSAPFERDLVQSPGSGTSAEVPFSQTSGAAVYLRHTWGSKVPSFYDVPLENHTAYAYTWIYSPENCSAGLHFSTHNYSRSELDATPPAGSWDYKFSRVWLNGESVIPPEWGNVGVKSGYEIPYSGENMWNRLPVKVSLRKGWNSIVIKLPVGRFTSQETRLVKWMFTAMIVTADGSKKPEGLVYSLNRF